MSDESARAERQARWTWIHERLAAIAAAKGLENPDDQLTAEEERLLAELDRLEWEAGKSLASDGADRV